MAHSTGTKTYLASFPNTDLGKSRRLKALELALDIRKFEIELYWKRAAYFWAFSAASFAAYFTVSAAARASFPNKSNTLLLVACIGLVFSVAWYFVNRASKFWQNNWEKHVDLLEDDVLGPLYKTKLSEGALSFWQIEGSYPFSVSKINQLLSLFVAGIFFLLLAETLRANFVLRVSFDFFPSACIVFTFLSILLLFWKGRTGANGKHTVESAANLTADLRHVSISKYSLEKLNGDASLAGHD